MVPNREGRLDLVAVAYRDPESPKAIWHATQTLRGGDTTWHGDWSDWRSLGKPDGQLAAGIRPAVGVNADGRLEVAVVGTDVFHAWQHPDGELVGLVLDGDAPRVRIGHRRFDARVQRGRAPGAVHPGGRRDPVASLAG